MVAPDNAYRFAKVIQHNLTERFVAGDLLSGLGDFFVGCAACFDGCDHFGYRGSRFMRPFEANMAVVVIAVNQTAGPGRDTLNCAAVGKKAGYFFFVVLV